MKFKSPVVTLTAILFALGLAACASKEEKPAPEPVKIESVQPAVIGPIDELEPVEPVAEEPVFTARDALLQVRTFYFNFDDAELSSPRDDSLDAHAEEILAKLADNSALVVTVEGHADERGTIEYNNALGNKRAETVARYLRVRGVPSENLETISYGELRPVAEGQDETSWSLNRRVVLDY